MKTKVLILDNNDSFTWNLALAIEKTGIATAEVIPSHQASELKVANFSHIIISPGPGLPDDYPYLQHLFGHQQEGQAILGVCLGHQAIAQIFGAQLMNLAPVRHGLQLMIKPISDPSLFQGLEEGFLAGLYHSWAISPFPWPDCLDITAIDEQGHIMALRHKELNIRGIQFHPESYMTPTGVKILQQWLQPIVP